MSDPALPREYVLHKRAVVADLLAATVELAAQGAEEGSLLWALRQERGETRTGARWQSGEEDLHLGLVLRPECDYETALQLVLVAAVSFGAALSAMVSPMVALHYRWPDDVLLAHAKVANLRLAGHTANGAPEWLALALNANLRQVPAALAFQAAAVETDGECEVSREALVEDFCRYFLRTINHWAEAGFSPILNAWRQRVAGIGEPCRLRLAHGEISGVLAQVRDDGAAVIATDTGDVVVPLSGFFPMADSAPAR